MKKYLELLIVQEQANQCILYPEDYDGVFELVGFDCLIRVN
jgi:hypothetical protein